MHTRIVLFCFIFSSLVVAGQQTPNAVPQSAQSKGRSAMSDNAGPITIRGCIEGGRERYTVTQQSTGTTFELQGDARRFESLREKPVEITAREAAPSRSTGRSDLPRLVVNEVHAIQGQCPFTAGGTPAQPTPTPTTIPEAQQPSTRNEQPPAATPRYEPPGAPNQMPPSVGNQPNVPGASGAPSPGSGNPPTQPPPPPLP